VLHYRGINCTSSPSTFTVADPGQGKHRLARRSSLLLPIAEHCAVASRKSHSMMTRVFICFVPFARRPREILNSDSLAFGGGGGKGAGVASVDAPTLNAEPHVWFPT
jgi:hypothetical protein